MTPTHDHEKIDRQETRPSKDRDRTEPAGRGGVGGGPEAKVTTRREGLAHGTAEGQRRVRAGDPRAWGGGARAWGGARRTGGGALGARQTETEDKGERGAEPRAPGTPTGTPTPTRHLHHTGRAPTRGRVLRDRTRGVPGTPQVPAHPHRKENAGAVQVETADTMTQRDSGGPGTAPLPGRGKAACHRLDKVRQESETLGGDPDPASVTSVSFPTDPSARATAERAGSVLLLLTSGACADARGRSGAGWGRLGTPHTAEAARANSANTRSGREGGREGAQGADLETGDCNLETGASPSGSTTQERVAQHCLQVASGTGAVHRLRTVPTGPRGPGGRAAVTFQTQSREGRT